MTAHDVKNRESIAASLRLAGTLASFAELGKAVCLISVPDSLVMELFGLGGACGALINTTGRSKGRPLSDILQHPVPVVVVTAGQEAAVIGKDCVFFIAGDYRGEGSP